MFRFRILICLLVVLVVSGMMGSAPTAHASLYDDMVLCWNNAITARAQAWAAQLAANSTITYAQYLAGLASDPTDGNAILVLALAHVVAGEGKMADSTIDFDAGNVHFPNHIFYDEQEAIDDYTLAISHANDAHTEFSAAQTHAMEAIAAFSSTEQVALDYAIGAEQAADSILEVESGAKALAYAEYGNANTAQAACTNEDRRLLGNGARNVAIARLNEADAGMTSGWGLYGDGQDHFDDEEWLEAVEDFDKAMTAFWEAEGLYQAALAAAQNAVANYLGEF